MAKKTASPRSTDSRRKTAAKNSPKNTAKTATKTPSARPAKRPAARKKQAVNADTLVSPQTRTLPATEHIHRWTFLTNHAHVLTVLHHEPEIILRQVAMQVGITERAVQRIVQDLEEGGFIRREKVGRKNRYQVLTKQSLRHPIEAHRTIGDLLNLILS